MVCRIVKRSPRWSWRPTACWRSARWRRLFSATITAPLTTSPKSSAPKFMRCGPSAHARHDNRQALPSLHDVALKGGLLVMADGQFLGHAPDAGGVAPERLHRERHCYLLLQWRNRQIFEEGDAVRLRPQGHLAWRAEAVVFRAEELLAAKCDSELVAPRPQRERVPFAGGDLDVG